MTLVRTLLVMCFIVLLSACASTGGARVSEPDASLQQVQVDARGQWQVTVRLQNYSSIGMRFDRIALVARFSDAAQVNLTAAPAITVPAESADVIQLQLTPDAQTKLFIADALVNGRSVSYTLGGTLTAAPGETSARTYTLDSKHNQLSPVPGLPGTLR